MSLTATLDERKYRVLLDRTLPAVIKTEAEYRRTMQAFNVLVEKDEAAMTEEEGRMLELLAILLEDYEGREHQLPKARPHKMLAHLLEDKGLKPSALWAVLPKSRVSEILAGKRGISKDQAKKLSEFLAVPVELFL
jgi:HTH-type transcriptional regulator/antitoxin HigA